MQHIIFSILRARGVLSRIDFNWKALWQLPLPLRNIILLWKIIHRILPTVQLLNYRHISIPIQCNFCQQAPETVEHLFLQCSFARAVWFGIPLTIRPDRLQSQDITSWLQILFRDLTQNHSLIIDLIYDITEVLDQIWYQRN